MAEKLDSIRAQAEQVRMMRNRAVKEGLAVKASCIAAKLNIIIGREVAAADLIEAWHAAVDPNVQQTQCKDMQSIALRVAALVAEANACVELTPDEFTVTMEGPAGGLRGPPFTVPPITTPPNFERPPLVSPF
jgi:hypothetical protein